MILKEQENKNVYSDGVETEEQMLEIAKKYPEDLSQDYIANISSYTLNNTFSSVRRNILNWYPFDSGSEILEVGAGMGAVTGLLCDVAKNVTAIEMSKSRANVIKSRYPQRNNLTVISEDITTWKTDKKFDYVVFIGVLEYAAIFSESMDPYRDFLLSISNLLKKGGKVLFAIENKFGLKYWLGASEDHLQKPFVGVAGYKEEKTARTFSRYELKELLKSVGLEFHRFYSVLPDYKFPELIFSDEYVPNYMNLKKVTFTYSKNSMLLANEKDLYKDIIGNNVFSFFSNSLLVEASHEPLSENHIVHVSAKGEVYKEFRVSTIIDDRGNVIKKAMHNNANVHLQNIADNTEYLTKRGVKVLPVKFVQDELVSKKYDGISAQDEFVNALKNNDRRGVYNLIDVLQKNFLKSSEAIPFNINNILYKHKLGDINIDYGLILQKAFIDMTFYNSFWENNDLIFYDQEWCFERVPLRFCLFYAVKSAYTKADVKTEIKFDELLKYLKITDNEALSYNALEEFIWSNVLYRQTDFYGAEGYCNRYSDNMTFEHYKTKNKEKIEELENRVLKIDLNYKELEQQYSFLQMQCKKEEEKKDNEISQLEKKLQETEKENIRKSDKLQTELNNCKKLHAEIDNCNTMLSEYENKVQDLNQTILNKEGHIEQLLEVEREYEREKTSRTYRLALRFRRLSVMLLPVNSKRRFFFKIIKKGLRHPGLMLKMINPRRVKNCFTILKTEGMDSAVNHYRLVEEYEKSRTVPLEQNNLEVIKVQEEPKHIEDYVPLSFTEFESPEISIIIPVYNQFDYTYHCLEAILNNSESWQYEVIIADDCSSDLTTNLNEVVTGVKIFHNKENLHFLLNCNNAAKQASGKYIVFLNNDTQVQKDWLTYLVALMRQDSSIGMVGSKLLYADGYLQEAGGILWKDASAWNYGNRQNPNDSEFNYVHEADYISGAAIMIRTFLWKEIGGFDESFVPAYCEDSDLAFEVRKHGYKVMYQPKSVVVHFEGISNGTDLTSGQKKYQVENQKKFYAKWKDELEKNHFDNGTELFVARDRSQKKKHVLVIDHYVPQYDKDAGSKTTFMYLKMLVSKGYKITFLGDNFYQHEPYTTELQQMGIFVLYGPKYAENWKAWLLENINYFDIFYLNRPHITIKYIDFIKENTNKKIIYYGHDLHFLRIRREYELSGNQKTADEAERWLKQELSIMRKADMNYYPSVIEKDEIHKMDSSIPVKAITAYVYEMFREVRYIPDKRQGLLFVGGFGHDPNLDAVLWFLEKIYPKVYEKTNAPFYIVGSKAPDSILQIRTPGVVVKGFVAEEELQMLYDTSRIAVVPLRYGAGVKGKVVEALYYGIPIVTTSVGAEGIEGIKNIAIIQDQEEEIIETICELYQNPDKLSEMSAHSQRFVREKFSTEAVWNIIKDDFDTGKEI